MPDGFPRSIFAYFSEGGVGVLEAAVKIMRAYKRKGVKIDWPFDEATFDRDNPWFVRLWGEIKPGECGDQIGVAVTMSGEAMIELLAFVGPTREGYPLLMSKERFEREYEVD